MPIIINMDKARAIHLQTIRAARNIKLAELDVPYMRAVESGDMAEQQAIARRKQVLRDLPATTNVTRGIDTPEQLINVWPEELNGLK